MLVFAVVRSAHHSRRCKELIPVLNGFILIGFLLPGQARLELSGAGSPMT